MVEPDSKICGHSGSWRFLKWTGGGFEGSTAPLRDKKGQMVGFECG